MPDANTPSYTKDQMKAVFRYAYPNFNEDQVNAAGDFYSKNPNMLGGASYGGYGPGGGQYGQAQSGSITGAQPLSSLLGLMQSFSQKPQSGQQQSYLNNQWSPNVFDPNSGISSISDLAVRPASIRPLNSNQSF